MHCIVSRLHVIPFILFILASGTLLSQVHISERVAIAPSGDTTQGAQNQLIDKWKALTKNAKSFEKVKASSQEKNKLSALIGLPASGNVTVTVLDGASATIIDLVLRSPIQETIVKDANNHHGFVWEGTGFPSGTTLDFGIWWYSYYGMSGWEDGCDISQVDDSTYILGFEDTGAPPINVDLIVQVVLGGIPTSPPVDHFDVTLLPDTIHQLDVSTFRVRARDALNNDIFLQPNTQLKITADDGGTYGHVGENGVPGEVFSYRDAYNGTVGYNADGDVPDNVQKVMIRVEKAEEPGKNGTGNLYIAPLDHFEVHPRTNTIHHAEQTAIFVQARDANNQSLQYYGGNVQISASPSGYGHLTYVTPSAIAGPKDKVGKPISLSVTSGKGKASSSLESVKPTGSNSLASDDPPLVVDYWTASHGLVFYTADGAAPVGDITITLSVSAVDKPSATGTGNLLLTRKNFDILLGETQYFYAVKDPDHSDRLTIKEFSTPKNGNTNVLFEDPQVVEGDKLGVYWEYKDADGNDLTSTTPGCVRLIGRYWKPDQKYTVRLIAKLPNGSRADTIVVEVKKPVRLFDKDAVKGDDNFRRGTEYGSTSDIRNAPLDIDSLCIWYANALGMPPQLIKSQIFQESDKTGYRFNPSYRYEPFFDLRSADPERGDAAEEYLTQPFVVTENSMGEGEAIPPDHQNVKPSYYPLTQTKIGRFAVEHWRRYWNIQKQRVEGSKDLTEFWHFLYDVGSIVLENPETFATTLAKEFALQNYTNIAQTRKAASYGIVQMLYTTAQGRGYNAGKTIRTSFAPEKLNDQVIEMPLYESYMDQKICEQFGESAMPEVPASEWTEGWERAWRNVLKKYNKDKDYAPSVTANSKKFYPQSK